VTGVQTCALPISTTLFEQATPDVAVGVGDAVFVTWSSRHQDGSDWGVYGQLFDSSGVKQGGEILINTETSQSQVDASVTATASGFAVAWQSRNQDGDGWGVFLQQLGSDASQVGAETQVNTQSAGNQIEVDLATNEADDLVVVWTDGVEDGTGWNVAARTAEITTAGMTFGGEFEVSSVNGASQLGHQASASLSAIDQAFAIAWSGNGASDHDGVFLRCFPVAEVNLSPNLAPIADQSAVVGTELVVEVTATDPNAGDTLTYILDPENSPAGATIEKIDNNRAVIRWTPTSGDLPGPVTFGVLVIDDGNPALADSEEFQVMLSSTA